MKWEKARVILAAPEGIFAETMLMFGDIVLGSIKEVLNRLGLGILGISEVKKLRLLEELNCCCDESFNLPHIALLYCVGVSTPPRIILKVTPMQYCIVTLFPQLRCLF